MLDENLIGERMRELARKEGHRKSIPRTALASSLGVGERRRSERLLDVLRANGPLTRKELASALGISYGSVCDYARPLIASGEVVRAGANAELRYFVNPKFAQ